MTEEKILFSNGRFSFVVSLSSCPFLFFELNSGTPPVVRLFVEVRVVVVAVVMEATRYVFVKTAFEKILSFRDAKKVKVLNDTALSVLGIFTHTSMYIYIYIHVYASSHPSPYVH